MQNARALTSFLALTLVACAHASPPAGEEPTVTTFACEAVTAPEPPPPPSGPTLLAEGALTIDVPGLTPPHDDNVAARGSVTGDAPDAFYAVHWRRGEGPVDMPTMRRVAEGLRLFQGTTFEEIALADGRPALRARTTSEETGDHEIGVVFGVGPFLMLVMVARLESYADDEALRAANSVRETSP